MYTCVLIIKYDVTFFKSFNQYDWEEFFRAIGKIHPEYYVLKLYLFKKLLNIIYSITSGL